MKEKYISRAQLASKLNMSEFELIIYLNEDTFLDLKFIKNVGIAIEEKVEKILDVTNEEITYKVFNNEGERTGYSAWLKMYKSEMLNKKIDFKEYSKKRNYTP